MVLSVPLSSSWAQHRAIFVWIARLMRIGRFVSCWDDALSVASIEKTFAGDDPPPAASAFDRDIGYLHTNSSYVHCSLRYTRLLAGAGASRDGAIFDQTFTLQRC